MRDIGDIQDYVRRDIEVDGVKIQLTVGSDSFHCLHCTEDNDYPHCTVDCDTLIVYVDL